MKSFCRLSAPGSSALSIWQMRGSEEDCAALFGKALPQAQNAFRLDAKSLPFDEALLWRRTDEGGGVNLECHLHGGYGVAAAFRDWMAQHDWSEVPAADSDQENQALWHANSPLTARVLSAHRNHAFQKELERMAALPLAEKREAVHQIAQWNAWAEVLEQPRSIVLAGPPNVGKSTLFNHWNRAALATTYDGQGTTRDALEVPVLLGASGEETLFTLTDTAGIGHGLSALDQQAMLLAWEQINSAWKVVWIVDTVTQPGPNVLERLQNPRSNDLIVLNRTDLKAGWVPSSLGIVPNLSGQRDQVDALLRALEAELLKSLGPPPPPGSFVALKEFQREALEALLVDCD